MSEQTPFIEESSRFNLLTSIWIVPFIALLVAGWLAFQYFSERGEEIRIVFPKNEGLNAGQSQIKFRDVPIGTVQKIELQKNGNGVVVVARIDKLAKPYLNEKAKFWIVKPEVGISGVSGLDTLLSGTYINMYSETEGRFKDSFYGLKEAFHQNKEGVYYKLTAPSGFNINRGTPVHFKNLTVGRVEYVNISLDSQNIDFIVLIQQQYVPYVHRDSKFWVTSTIDLRYANGRFDINVAPLSNLVQGGIEFSSTHEDPNDPVPDHYVFRLYKNSNAAEGTKIGKGGEFVKTFEIMTQESLSTLRVGAMVQYSGYEVGRVKDIALQYIKETHVMQGRVLVDIDTSAFAQKDDTVKKAYRNFRQMVEEGLRAKMQPSDPLTGTLFVDLGFEANVTKQTLVQGKKYALLPSVKSDAGGVMDEAEKLLQKLNALPLEQLLASLNKVVDNSDGLLSDLGKSVKDLNALSGKKSFQTMPDELDKTLKELTKTLATAQQTIKSYDDQSLLASQIAQTLKVVTETSKSMQQFLDMLNRKPDSLIFGEQ